MLLAAVFVVAVLSGATATVAGFEMGRPLTPIVALRLGTASAIAAGSMAGALFACPIGPRGLTFVLGRRPRSARGEPLEPALP